MGQRVAAALRETLTDPDDPRTLWRITIKEPSAKLDAFDVLAPTFVSGAM